MRKPLYSREGANIEVVIDGDVVNRDQGPCGAEGFVRQALAPLPVFDGNRAVIGSRMVGDTACGIGMREDTSPITKNTSHFAPVRHSRMRLRAGSG